MVEGSPAIDAGNNTVCSSLPINNLDQRGELRPVTRCDIGAFERVIEQVEPETTLFVVPLSNGKTVTFGL